MADAAYVIFNRPAKETTGNFFIDDEVLASAGKTDLSEYAVDPSVQLMPDFFV
jgi:citronellol/citronellal dehydrogenase